jgi:glutamine synthetase type III
MRRLSFFVPAKSFPLLGTIDLSSVKLLNILGDKETKRVYSTLGTEQEFFLIDRNIYNLRPDLKIAGRTLVGIGIST